MPINAESIGATHKCVNEQKTTTNKKRKQSSYLLIATIPIQATTDISEIFRYVLLTFTFPMTTKRENENEKMRFSNLKIAQSCKISTKS